MKLVKGFVKTCYSETLVSNAETRVEEQENEKDESSGKETYHGGLGLKFKFPGDPKKYVPGTVSLLRI